MTRTIDKIIADIRLLMEELETVSAAPTAVVSVKSTKKLTGCSGAIQALINDKFFDTPRIKSEVVEKLKEEGQHFPGNLISMNLLNLVKRKTLRRLPGENGHWRYVVRT